MSAPAFQSEEGFTALLDVTRELFGVDDIEIGERWQGVYCSAPGQEFLVEEPIEGTHVVTVTTGIGMTTSMGLALSSIDNAFAPADPVAVTTV